MRLIDADALCGWLKGAGSYLKGLENHKPLTKAIGVIINHTEAMPAIDAVEVVRCKDCKHAKKAEGVKHTNGFCRCEYFFLDLEEDHFCSYGERKDE